MFMMKGMLMDPSIRANTPPGAIINTEISVKRIRHKLLYRSKPHVPTTVTVFLSETCSSN